MTRFMGRHIAPEMLALLLAEAGLTFALACALLAPNGLRDGWLAPTVEHAGIVAITVGLTSFLLGLYRPQMFLRVRNLLLNTALGGLLAFVAVWAVSELLGMTDGIRVADVPWVIKIVLIWIATLFALRLGLLLAVRFRVFVRPVAILGAPGDVADTVLAIRSGRAGFFEVVTPADTEPAVLRAHGVRHALTSVEGFAVLPPTARASYAAAGIELEPEPEFWERHLKRIDTEHVTPEWFAALDARPQSRWQAVFNRTGDVAISLGFLVFTLPLMLLVALLVRLDSPGSVLYRQERVGLGGRPFVLLKFRSMNANAEARGPAWAQTRDPRVTRVGNLMRRTRIDELPQLVNVLRGEMSFIGPRPERPHFVEQLADEIPNYRERARVKPGLTGWAQVNYPYGASVEDARAKLSYDLFYVKHRTPLLDLGILFATVRVILFQEGSR